MKTNLHFASIALAICALTALPVSANAGSVRLNAKTSLSVTLTPTVAAPVGASGSAEIRIREKNDTQTAHVRLEVAGLAAGAYELDATLADASVAVLGSFTVGAGGVPIEQGEDDGTIHFQIPGTVDAGQIVSLEVADASAVVVLEGSTTLDVSFVNFFANVPVTGPTVTTSDAHPQKRVHGHALAQSTVINNVETKRHFLWVAFGAPADTVLTINVDGTAVGTVTSTKQGKVMFHSLDDSVDLATMKLITLTDPTSAVIMQAQF